MKRSAQDPGIRVPPQVQEGGVLEIEVGSGVREVWVGIPGRKTYRVPVIGGRAEFRLPPSAPGGTRLLVSDMKVPNPSNATVDVVGNR
ncbi:MAG: hypothetical protein AB7I19_19490 [Planctomycetota bacterium]